MRTAFEVNDVVAQTIRYGAGMEKHHVGDVVAIGARGVEVNFRDPSQSRAWVHAGKLRFVVGVDEVGRPVLAKHRPEEPSPPKLSVVRAPVEEPAAIAAPALVPSLDALASAGVDPMGMWLALGRELVGREQRVVTDADARVRAADEEVATAEVILADARVAAAEARKSAENARARLAEINRRLGGAS